MLLRRKPVLCNYYVTYRCNATCSFCDIWERPSPYVTLDVARQNLQDLKRLGVKVIDFTGGEPLLHREIDLLLKEAKSLGFITTLTTNAMLYPKKAESIQGLVDMLHFSLDSPIEAEHNASRGVACFGLVQESIHLARSLGERPDIIFTVFDHNLHHIRQMWEDYAVGHNLVLILNPAFGYNQVDTGNQLSPSQLSELRLWGRKKNVFLNEAFVQLRLDGGNHLSEPVCKALTTTLVISPQNELVLPCYHLGLESIPIQGNLYDLYHSDKVQKMRQMEGRLPGCEGCTVNCYMQPSFTVNLNRYWFMAAPSALKYNRIKGTWRKALRF